ncbi:hypothetical protein KsCSTR_33300 [Candidatus Kuenenia stuttgartiensis]|uniref:Uncharacterized protein n=1 Tax=Kuenenia stuttgartiensis TaxID=174633 RepID=Q1Q4G8_KUEST|nr:hypothetical protein KsCSTR_33300 [Candidatus Kuenenia stuttgartiensis]CAJ74905.1 unknown protein [Candidatus Kuenenia stuttgartiensis]
MPRAINHHWRGVRIFFQGSVQGVMGKIVMESVPYWKGTQCRFLTKSFFFEKSRWRYLLYSRVWNTGYPHPCLWTRQRS